MGPCGGAGGALAGGLLALVGPLSLPLLDICLLTSEYTAPICTTSQATEVNNCTTIIVIRKINKSHGNVGVVICGVNAVGSGKGNFVTGVNSWGRVGCRQGCVSH